MWILLITPSNNLIFDGFRAGRSMYGVESPVQEGSGRDVACQIILRRVNIVAHAPKAASCGSKDGSCVEPTDCNAEQMGHTVCSALRAFEGTTEGTEGMLATPRNHMLVSADPSPSHSIASVPFSIMLRE